MLARAPEFSSERLLHTHNQAVFPHVRRTETALSLTVLRTRKLHFSFPSTERAKNQTFPRHNAKLFWIEKCDSLIRIAALPLSLAVASIFGSILRPISMCFGFCCLPFAGSGELCCCMAVCPMTLTVALVRIITGFLYTGTHHFSRCTVSAIQALRPRANKRPERTRDSKERNTKNTLPRHLLDLECLDQKRYYRNSELTRNGRVFLILRISSDYFFFVMHSFAFLLAGFHSEWRISFRNCYGKCDGKVSKAKRGWMNIEQSSISITRGAKRMKNERQWQRCFQFTQNQTIPFINRPHSSLFWSA